MPSITAESTRWEAERAELQTVLQAPIFVRSPALSHLLSYLCEKTFADETDQIKEYTIALDVFERRDSFDQDTDSIVRVEANRLRKRLREYYAHDGASDLIRITIPVGQYVPSFEKSALSAQRELLPQLPAETHPIALGREWYRRSWMIADAAATGLQRWPLLPHFRWHERLPGETPTRASRSPPPQHPCPCRRPGNRAA